jgi:hypothetical protein
LFYFAWWPGVIFWLTPVNVFVFCFVLLSYLVNVSFICVHCIHTCFINVCMCLLCMHVHICVCTYRCACMYVHMHVNRCVCFACMCVVVKLACKFTQYVCVYLYNPICMKVYAFTYFCVCVCVCIYIYIYVLWYIQLGWYYFLQ